MKYILKSLLTSLSYVLLLLVYGYRHLISPWLPKSCRFYPTCSEYSILCLKKHGFFTGSWLTFKRLCACHPFSSKCGYDPIPINVSPIKIKK